MSVHVSSYVWRQTPKIDPTAMLVLVALADQANDEGLSWYAVGTIATRCRISETQARRWLRWLESADLIEISERPGKSSLVTVTMTPAVEHTPAVARTPAVDHTPPLRSTAPHPYGSPHPTPAVARTRTITNHQRNHQVNHQQTDDFDEFWLVYPRKAGKRAARVAWDRAVQSVDAPTIVAAAARYRDDPNRQGAFTAHPSTWLNQDRWEDEPLPDRGGQTRLSGTAMYLEAASVFDGWGDSETGAIEA